MELLPESSSWLRQNCFLWPDFAKAPETHFRFGFASEGMRVRSGAVCNQATRIPKSSNPVNPCISRRKVPNSCAPLLDSPAGIACSMFECLKERGSACQANRGLFAKTSWGKTSCCARSHPRPVTDARCLRFSQRNHGLPRTSPHSPCLRSRAWTAAGSLHQARACGFLAPH
jgi:hypothetical protein